MPNVIYSNNQLTLKQNTSCKLSDSYLKSENGSNSLKSLQKESLLSFHENDKNDSILN